MPVPCRRSLVTARTLTLLTLLLIATCLTGCVIGNSTEVSRHRATTIGQELIDLERAKEEGLITKDEYQRLRQNIFEMSEPIEVNEDVYEGEE